ncbi:hypothetical protein F441_03332, partial [Phytophthora nicotianae CJ01A1]
NHKIYNMYFRVCVALTNLNVRFRPLRREDGDSFLRYEERLRQIGAGIEAEKKRKREEYRDSRRARLQLGTSTRTRPRASPSISPRFSISRNLAGSPCSTTYGSP